MSDKARIMTLEELKKCMERFHTGDNAELVERAWHFAQEAHKDQKRKSGEPYFVHPAAVASTLAELMMDGATIAAGLLHDCVEDCETYAEEREGVHFHWVNEGADASASGEEAYAASGCQADCQATYEKFTALRYSYALEEEEAREGYIRHGLHSEDIPIEIITTDASQNGANAVFSGAYSGDLEMGSLFSHSLEAAEETEKEEE